MDIVAYSGSLIPFINLRELSKSGVVFAVNRYECFMEIENMLKTFCGCKPYKKTLSFIKILLILIKKEAYNNR